MGSLYVIDRMKYLFQVLFATMLFTASQGIAQPVVSADDNEWFGLDPLLYNGRFYTYFVPSSTKGTPYFNGPDFVTGSVTLRGITYMDLPLKYDVINQQLILQYMRKDGGIKKIILSEAWLEAFSLGNDHFELYTMEDSIKQIYQVIGNGSCRILYTWSKYLNLDPKTGSHRYIFSELEKKEYLLSENIIMPYKNNKSFVALFQPSKQTMLKKYLQHEHINVKKASDEVMTELVIFCNSKVAS